MVSNVGKVNMYGHLVKYILAIGLMTIGMVRGN